MPKEQLKNPKLLARQARFVEEYLVDCNGTRAAIAAGYSERSAASMACDLLKLPKVTAALEAARGAQSERVQLRADDVLNELRKVAFSDIAKAFGPDGQLLNLHDMPPEGRAALAGVETEELYEGKGEERVQVGVSRKVKHWDKVKALEILARHFGLLRDKVEHTGEGGGPLTVELVRYSATKGG